MQTPHYPTGDGACSKPCDCGVPCGRYLWDTRNKELVDWLVNTHLTGDISPAEQGGLINVRSTEPGARRCLSVFTSHNAAVTRCLGTQGVFLDDDISATGGFAENCNL